MNENNSLHFRLISLHATLHDCIPYKTYEFTLKPCSQKIDDTSFCLRCYYKIFILLNNRYLPSFLGKMLGISKIPFLVTKKIMFGCHCTLSSNHTTEYHHMKRCHIVMW